jgi:outer membrane protein assembly factor BamB
MISKKIPDKRWLPVVRNLAVISAGFAFIIAILLIVNFIQIKSIEPLNSKALNQLMLKLQQDPENTALKEQIRALDLLARKAYFTYQWQIRTGSYLLLLFVIILLLGLKYINAFTTRLPDLEQTTAPESSWQIKILSRKSIVFSGIGLFLIAFILGLISENEIGDTGTSTAAKMDYPSMEEFRKNWPGFRGPEGNGIAYQSGFPTEWDGATGKNIIWKTAIPKPGFNSPIIWENRLYLAGADQTSQTVYAIDTQTGAIIWQAEIKNIPGSPEKQPKVTGDTGLSAPTMTTNGKYLFVIFATGDIACLNFDGTIVWAKNLGLPDNHYGHSSSLIAWQNLVLVQYDHNSARQLLALDDQSGSLIYTTTRDVQISWASPILVNTGKRMEIILNSNPFVIAYNPQNGQELWRLQCMDGEVAPSPAYDYSEHMVFVVNEFAVLAAIKVNDSPEMSWEYEDDLSEVASPVAADGLLFVPTSYGVVSCFDARNGERYWNHEFQDGFYASPIIVHNLVYLMDTNGLMQIFAAEKEFKLVQQAPLGEKAMTIPAFYNECIFIRGVENLYCIGNKDD